MSDAGRKRHLSELPSRHEGNAPYLPPPHGRLKEKLARFRFQATYWIWKLMILRYGDRSRLGEATSRFLDIGCGPGNFVCCLESWFPDTDITGLDMSLELLNYSAGRTERANFLQGNAERLPFGDMTFHVLSGLQVIEHLGNPEKFLGEAHRVLKENGLLLLTTPNPRGLASRLLKERWQGIRYDHISVRPPEQWREALEKSGFAVLKEGTTLLNGIPIIGRFPLGLPFQLLQAFFGWFPWFLGESYMALALKRDSRERC